MVQKQICDFWTITAIPVSGVWEMTQDGDTVTDVSQLQGANKELQSWTGFPNLQ